MNSVSATQSQQPEYVDQPGLYSKLTLRRNPLADPRQPPEDLSLEPKWASSIISGRGVHLPYQHPRTHNIPVAVIHFRSFFPHLLGLYTHFAAHAASSLGIPISKPVFLPTQRSLWTVLKGPFVHKKNQENFERRVHKRAIKAYDADPEVVERWIKYLESHAMGGVGLRIVRWERVQVGVGEERLKGVVDQMRLASVRSADKVKALGDKIVEQEMAVAAEHPEITQVDKKTSS